MAFPVWPLTVNPYAIRGSYQASRDRNVKSVKPEVGPAIESRRSSVSGLPVQFEGRYTAAEVADLDDFYESTLTGGVLPFALKDPLSGRLGIFKFTDSPKLREVKQLKRRYSHSMFCLSMVQAETQALHDAMASPPTAERALINDNLIAGQKRYGVWAKCSAMWGLAAHSAEASLLNWVTPSAGALTALGSPTFDADRGYTGDGAGAYLQSSYNYGSIASRNNAAAFVWTLTDGSVGANGADLGTLSSGNFAVNSRNGSTFASRGHTSGSNSVSGVSSAAGFFGFSRTVSGNYKAFVDVTPTTISVASEVPTSSPITFLRRGSVFSPRQVAWGAIYTGLTTDEVVIVRRTVSYWLRQLGAIA